MARERCGRPTRTSAKEAGAMTLEERHAAEQFCYLTTIGRVTGNPHEIEIWFGLVENTLYILSGGRDRSDWVKNLANTPSVGVRVALEHPEDVDEGGAVHGVATDADAGGLTNAQAGELAHRLVGQRAAAGDDA